VVNNVLLPVPSDVSKGILVTATLHGNTIVGPNAMNVHDKEDRSVSGDGLTEIWDGAHKLVPGLTRVQPLPCLPGCAPRQRQYPRCGLPQ
jgi:glycerol-3-phosphate dehydrogenase